MDNYKLVMISILYLKHDKKYDFVFLEDMHEKPLGFGRMQKKNIFFYVFEMRKFFFKILEKNKVFLISGLYLIV
jgi:hypothetical protein